MRVVKKPIKDLVPAPYNPRKKLRRGDKEFEAIKQSVQTYGYVEPIVWNERTGHVVGGNQRLMVLQEMGATEVEVSVVDLSEEREKALNVALNKVHGDWDLPSLRTLLEEIETDWPDAFTGFDESDLEELAAMGSELDVIDHSARKDESDRRTVPGHANMIVSVGTLAAVVDCETVRAMMQLILERWGPDNEQAILGFCRWVLETA